PRIVGTYSYSITIGTRANLIELGRSFIGRLGTVFDRDRTPQTQRYRTCVSRSERGRAANAAIQPTKSRPVPKTASTVPSFSAAGSNPSSPLHAGPPPGSSAAEGPRSVSPPLLRGRRASFRHSSYVLSPPVSTT